MTDVVMPQMGESIVEGTLTKWLKKTGDKVERDEPLFEISTDKVDTEIPSPAAGTLGELLVQEGQTVQVNAIVARINDGGNAAAAPAAPASGSTSSPKTAPPGSRLRFKRSMGSAIAAASGPARRTTPMPPRPGGVAMATMVSSRFTEGILTDGVRQGWPPVA